MRCNRADGHDSVELTDGCICCSLSRTLHSALKNIKKDIGPDIILIEPTGLAPPHKVNSLVQYAMIDQDEIISLGITDIKRFDELIEKKEELFKRQIFSTDIILISKSDLAAPKKLAEATA